MVNDRAIARDLGKGIDPEDDRIRVSAITTIASASTAITIAIITVNDRDRVNAITEERKSITNKIDTSIGNRSLEENDLQEMIVIVGIVKRNVNDPGIEFNKSFKN